jgi:hypothetical protein
MNESKYLNTETAKKAGVAAAVAAGLTAMYYGGRYAYNRFVKVEKKATAGRPKTKKTAATTKQ